MSQGLSTGDVISQVWRLFRRQFVKNRRPRSHPWLYRQVLPVKRALMALGENERFLLLEKDRRHYGLAKKPQELAASTGEIFEILELTYRKLFFRRVKELQPYFRGAFLGFLSAGLIASTISGVAAVISSGMALFVLLATLLLKWRIHCEIEQLNRTYDRRFKHFIFGAFREFGMRNIELVVKDLPGQEVKIPE